VIRRTLLSVGIALLLAFPAGSGAAQVTTGPALGVIHSSEHHPEGPWMVHRVEVDPGVCGVSIATAKGGDRLEGVETVSALAARSSAFVAVNADFFRAQPFGVVEGPHVQGGEVVATAGNYGPSVSTRFQAEQGVFGVSTEGRPFVGEVTIAGEVRTPRFTESFARVNAPPGPDSVAFYNRFAGQVTPADSGAVEVIVRVAYSEGAEVTGVVEGVDTIPEGVRTGQDTVVFATRGALAAEFLRIAPGDTLRWELHFIGAPGRVTELVGGFPLLLRDGDPVLDRVPAIRAAFALERHPRSAIGVRRDGTVLIVTVDGRQPGYSEGMTLPELTDLLVELGAVDALNLDGGGSTTLVVGGQVVNRPSDPVERPVTNAVVVRWDPRKRCGGS
jgi:hypothetical protein